MKVQYKMKINTFPPGPSPANEMHCSEQIAIIDYTLDESLSALSE